MEGGIKRLWSFFCALKINPDQVAIYNNLGLSLQALDCQEEAIGCYHQAQKLQPDQPFF